MICTKCEVDKPADTDHFYAHSNTVSGLHPRCIECAKARSKELRQDPERREDIRKKASNYWLSKSKEERSSISTERRLKDRFKRSTQWYEDTLKEQGDHCALCTEEPKNKRFHVDHDHDCCDNDNRLTCGNCVRGLLCDGCNTKLGYFETFLDSIATPAEFAAGSFAVGSWEHKAMQYLASYPPADSAEFVTMEYILGKTQETTQ